MNPLQHIFALAPDCHGPRNYSHLAWRRHIYEGLRPHVKKLVIPEELDFGWARQGHMVDMSAYADVRAKTSDLLWQRIEQAHRDHGLDAVISYCFAFDLELEVVKNTIKLGIPWVNFFCDSTHMFKKVEALARVTSLNWFPESVAAPQYEALGVPALCAPYAWNPDGLPDMTNRSAQRTAAFIGFPSADRITQLGWLRLFGCPAEIRGRGWIGEGENPFFNPNPARKRLLKAIFSRDIIEKISRRMLWPMVRPMAKGLLKDEDFADYCRDTLVVLGFNQAKDPQNRLASYLKFRDMEFPGYGCCYLTQYNDDIPKIFDVGREILTFSSAIEAASHLRRIRKKPELSRQIGQAGRRRVLEHHNWGVRLKQLRERL